MSLKSLLLDADIVIYAHQVNLWTPMKAKCRVIVPSIVAHQEARYFRSRKTGSQGIHLIKELESGEIGCLEADAGDVAAVTRDFVLAFSEALHDGEKEALGLLLAKKCLDCSYCTGDINAMQAAGMLALGDCMVSFETVVRELGLKGQLDRELPFHFRDSTLQRHIADGKQRRITREYFNS